MAENPDFCQKDIFSKEQQMNFGRLIGLALLALGAVLLIVGVTATDSVADQFSKMFSGEYTEGTMWLLIGGTVSAVMGLALTLFGGPERSRET